MILYICKNTLLLYINVMRSKSFSVTCYGYSRTSDGAIIFISCYVIAANIHEKLEVLYPWLLKMPRLTPDYVSNQEEGRAVQSASDQGNRSSSPPIVKATPDRPPSNSMRRTFPQAGFPQESPRVILMTARDQPPATLPPWRSAVTCFRSSRKKSFPLAMLLAALCQYVDLMGNYRAVLADNVRLEPQGPPARLLASLPPGL